METTQLTTTKSEQQKQLFPMVCGVCGNTTHLERLTTHQLTCPYCNRPTLQYSPGTQSSVELCRPLEVPIPGSKAAEMVQRAKEILGTGIEEKQVPKAGKQMATPEELEKARAEIIHMNKSGVPQKKIAARFNTSPATVQRIVAGTWKGFERKQRGTKPVQLPREEEKRIDNNIIETPYAKREMTPEQKASYYRELQSADPATRRTLQENNLRS